MPEIMRPDQDKAVAARRKFLATCGRFAIATPPAIGLLLAASDRNYANALSGGGGGHGHGHGHGHRHGHKHRHGRGHWWHGRGRGRGHDND